MDQENDPKKMILPKVLSELIFSYLSPPAIFLLKTLEATDFGVGQIDKEKLLLDSIQKDLEISLEKELGNDLFDDFLHAASASGACVAGSYPLQVLRSATSLEEINTLSDIDIFVPVTKSDEEALNLLKFHLPDFKHVNEEPSPITEWFDCNFVSSALFLSDASTLFRGVNARKSIDRRLWSYFNTPEQIYCESLAIARSKCLFPDWRDTKDFILKSFQGIHKGQYSRQNIFHPQKSRNLKIIHVKVPNGNLEARRKSLSQWIDKNFDMDVCKVSWFPKTGFRGGGQVCLPKHFVSSADFLQSVIDKRAKWNLDHFPEQQGNRYTKYLTRGWTIELPPQRELFAKFLRSRLERGFEERVEFGYVGNSCDDDKCLWNNFCKIHHEHYKSERVGGSTQTVLIVCTLFNNFLDTKFLKSLLTILPPESVTFESKSLALAVGKKN